MSRISSRSDSGIFWKSFPKSTVTFKLLPPILPPDFLLLDRPRRCCMTVRDLMHGRPDVNISFYYHMYLNLMREDLFLKEITGGQRHRKTLIFHHQLNSTIIYMFKPEAMTDPEVRSCDNQACPPMSHI